MSKSRYKKQWYHSVKLIIKLYPYTNISKESDRYEIYKAAIKQTMEELAELEDGDIRQEAIRLVLFNDRYTPNGVAYKLCISRRTLEKWVSAFVYAVGHKVGF